MDAVLARQFARREEILDVIRQILKEKLHVRREADEIDPDTPLFGTGLRLDSVDAVELWVMINTRFGVTPPEDERWVAAVRTLNTLTDLVVDLEGERSNEC